MDKNKFAITPPMGWNRYDYDDTAVTEEQVKANAEYMAEHLKKYGWEYIIIDIEWYSNDIPCQQHTAFGPRTFTSALCHSPWHLTRQYTSPADGA